MISVVIAAHDESAVIGRTLDRLLGDARPGELDIVVAANGCTDDTVRQAQARPGVRVLDLPEPGKPGALNAGDEAARGFPRLYLDADISFTTAQVRTLVTALEAPHPRGGGPLLAVAPHRRVDVTGRPLAVRAYFAVNNHLPAFRDALFGRGAILLSEEGRSRFDRFPDLVADDLFLDGCFAPHEKRQVDEVVSVVEAPRTTRALVRRLARVRRGNAAMRRAGVAAQGVRGADRSSWLRDVVVRRPWLVPAAAVYVVLTLAAERLARQDRDPGWARDDSRPEETTRA